jgi:hypothetical protein
MRCRGVGRGIEADFGPEHADTFRRDLRSDHAKVALLYSQVTANLHQSRTLATLRDALLPKLLSGELPVVAATA